MTREHLLEAMGLLDDELIREAEEPVRKERKKRHLETWISLAACLAIVLTIGYGVTHMGVGSGNTASGAASQETAEDWSGGNGGDAPGSAAVGEPGDSSPNMSDEVLLVIVPVGDKRYAYFHYYEEDRVLEILPEGCRSLGEVGRYTEGEDIPYTDMNVFPGCPLWIVGEGWDGPVYLETPEGVYLECILG